MSERRSTVVVSRDVSAVEIPFGNRITIPKGSTVQIAQALGGSFTVMTDRGALARIDARDADAIGQDPSAAESAAPSAGRSGSIEDRVWEILRSTYDPEIPVNIVELGLVYECKIERREEGYRVLVRFTLTAPGCGMGDVLKAEIEERLRALEEVREAVVEVVFDPPWDPSRMSEAARLQLGMI
jgi:probable FeS assembly SUF system protein SufT